MPNSQTTLYHFQINTCTEQLPSNECKQTAAYNRLVVTALNPAEISTAA